MLRAAGYEAKHLHELEQDRLPDEAILSLALRDGYVILTHDLDFSELIATSGAQLPTIVTFRLRDMRPVNANRHLQAIFLYQGATHFSDWQTLQISVELFYGPRSDR